MATVCSMEAGVDGWVTPYAYPAFHAPEMHCMST